MGDRYIWGVQLLVEDVPGAKRWLCENLFFVEEEHKGMICLRNGNFRLVLREDKEHLADKYGPDDMCLAKYGVGDTGYRGGDGILRKPGIKSADRRKRRTAV